MAEQLPASQEGLDSMGLVRLKGHANENTVRLGKLCFRDSV
jgi:hypothetical protein